MKCFQCGIKIIYLQDMGENGLCKKCYNAYMREYGQTRRWLNGSERTDDMGPKIPKVRFY